VALPCAFILKRFQAPAEGSEDTSRTRRDLAFSGTVYEIALVVMSAYMSYIAAEVCPPFLCARPAVGDIAAACHLP
jgi:hypothetical protein